MALSAQEKQKIIYKIDTILDEATKSFTFDQKILVQALFIERYYHFIEQAADELSLSIPALLRDMEKYLWRYLKGECKIDELESFHRASESVIIYLLVDDDDKLDKAAWEKYKNDWEDSLYFNLCLDEAASEWSYILEQAVRKEINWYELTDGEFMAILGYYIDIFELEPVYKKEDGCYQESQEDRHWLEIYDSHTFGKVISMLWEDLQIVKDMKKISKDEIQKLYIQYQNKIIFDKQQIEKIIRTFK